MDVDGCCNSASMLNQPYFGRKTNLHDNRMAIELELNNPPPFGCDERESLNRTRTWLNCFCVDGSHSIQFGKMSMVCLDNYVIRHSRFWYNSSSMNLPFDVHLCAYVDLILLMAEWKAIVEGGKSSEPDEVGGPLEDVYSVTDTLIEF